MLSVTLFGCSWKLHECQPPPWARCSGQLGLVTGLLHTGQGSSDFVASLDFMMIGLGVVSKAGKLLVIPLHVLACQVQAMVASSTEKLLATGRFLGSRLCCPQRG